MTPKSVAVITGGGTGIGAATAATLRGRGWEVIVCGRRPEAVSRVADMTGARAVVADVASASDMERLVADTVEQFGAINGLVLNAGIVRAGSAGELSDEDWNAMVSTNLTGPFLLVRAALPHLIKASATVPLSDGSQIYLDLTWQGTGPIARGGATSRDILAGQIVQRSAVHGTFQDAVVTGTLSFENASISQTRGSSMLVEIKSQ